MCTDEDILVIEKNVELLNFANDNKFLAPGLWPNRNIRWYHSKSSLERKVYF